MCSIRTDIQHFLLKDISIRLYRTANQRGLQLILNLVCIWFLLTSIKCLSKISSFNMLENKQIFTDRY